MKKIRFILIMLAVTLTLSACSKQEITIDIKELSDSLLQNVTFSDELTQIDEKVVESLYNIDNAINEYVYISSGATADEIAVFEFENADDAKKALENARDRISKQREDYETYIPAEVKKIDNAIVKNSGRYLIVCVSDGDEAAKIIDDYIN